MEYQRWFNITLNYCIMLFVISGQYNINLKRQAGGPWWVPDIPNDVLIGHKITENI